MPRYTSAKGTVPNDFLVKKWYDNFLKKIGYYEKQTDAERKALLGSFRVVKREYVEEGDLKGSVKNIDSTLAFAPVEFEDYEQQLALSDVDLSGHRDYVGDVSAPTTKGVREARSSSLERSCNTYVYGTRLSQTIKDAGTEENLPFYDSHFRAEIDEKAKNYKQALEKGIENDIKDKLALLEKDKERNAKLYISIRAYDPTANQLDLLQATRLFNAAVSGELYQMSPDGNIYNQLPYCYTMAGGFVDEKPEDHERGDYRPVEIESECLFFAQLVADPNSVEGGYLDETKYIETQKKQYAKDNGLSAEKAPITGKISIDESLDILSKKAAAVHQQDYEAAIKAKEEAEKKEAEAKKAPIPEKEVPPQFEFYRSDRDLINSYGENFVFTEEVRKRGIEPRHLLYAMEDAKGKVMELQNGVYSDNMGPESLEIRDYLLDEYTAYFRMTERLGLPLNFERNLKLFHVESDLLENVEKHGLDGNHPMSEEEFKDFLVGENGLIKQTMKISGTDKVALKELGMDIGDVVNSALRNGITVDQAMQNIRAELEQADRSVEAKYREQTDNVRAEFNANAVDKAIGDSFKEIRQNVVEVGGLENLKRAYAQLLTRKAIQDKLNCADEFLMGEDWDRAEAMVNDEKPWKDLLNSPKFNKYFEMHGIDDLRRIARAQNDFDLDDVYVDFKKGINDKTLDSVASRIERFHNIDAIPDKISYYGADVVATNGNWKSLPENPYHLSLDRTGLTVFGVCEMMVGGFPIDDILDPYKLNAEKLACGQIAWQKVADRSPQGANELRELLIESLDRSIKYMDKLMDDVKTFDLETFTSEKFRNFIRMANVMQDLGQEYRHVNDEQTPEQKRRMDDLLNKQTLYSAFTNRTTNMMRSVHELQNGTMEPGVVLSALSNDLATFCSMKQTLKIIRSLPGSKGKPMSQILADNRNLAISASSVVGQMAAQCAPEFDGRKIGRYYRDPEHQKQLAKDFISGKFEKTMDIKVRRDGEQMQFQINGKEKFYEPINKPQASMGK